MRVTPMGMAKTGSHSAALAADDPGLLADIAASKAIDISQCQTVCLALGPYRNLTTLTAATLFLHPHCQVLNHAGMRVYASPQLDFFLGYSAEKMDRFLRFAIHISAQGERGDYGGSIVHSHAFDAGHAMKDLFEKAGGETVKPVIRSLFWKESLLTANHIRENQVDLGHLFNQEPRLRFLLPVRHPLDCAVSNMKSVHGKQFPGISDNPDLRETTQAILEEVYWVAELKEKFPDRILTFYEHSIDETFLKQLAAFLKIEPSPIWIQQALAAMEIKKGYDHAESDLAWYRQHVAKRFARFPALCSHLLRFAPTG
jgi:hypothetical protein